MRTYYQNFALYIRSSLSKNPLVRIIIRCIILVLITCSLVTQTFGENIDWRLIEEISLNESPIDIATSPDGLHIFILTANAILVYSRKDEKIANRIPVGKAYDKISFSKSTNEFILTNAASKALNIIKIYPIYQINIDGLPFMGPSNAPVTAVIFDDYQCSNCAVLERIMKDVLQTFQEELKLVIKHFPNTDDPFSEKAAIAARAANAQGKFWEFHRALFERQTPINDDIIQSIATHLSLDTTKFNKDLHSQAIKAMVHRDIKDGRQLGIKTTPMVFINGKYLERRSLQGIIEMIETELNKKSSG